MASVAVGSATGRRGAPALRLSSPAAAAATLRSRAAVDEAADEEVEEVGRRTVLDQDDVDAVVALDFSPD